MPPAKGCRNSAREGAPGAAALACRRALEPAAMGGERQAFSRKLGLNPVPSP